MPRSPAISFKQFQNSSSTLTLVLWPAMLIERFKTRDTLPPPRMSQRYYMSQRYDIVTASPFGQEKPPDLMPPGDTEVSPSAVWGSRSFRISWGLRPDPLALID